MTAKKPPPDDVIRIGRPITLTPHPRPVLPGNVYMTCPEHASRPGGYTGQPPEGFVRKYVKLRFETNLLAPFPRHEHLWVFVEKLCTDGKEALIGKLDNDPRYAPWHCGDTLAFDVEEIEDVLP